MKFRNKNILKQFFCVAIFLVMISTSIVTAVKFSGSQKTVDDINEINSLSYTYKFNEPKLRKTSISLVESDYSLLEMDNCMNTGRQAGEPLMPVKVMRLLVPPMKEVKSIQITGTPVEVELDNSELIEIPVIPYQNSVPFGTANEEFVIKEDIYKSSLAYPSQLYEGFNVGYSRGYAILDVTVNPIQYIPSEGRIFYYPELSVEIELEDTETLNQFFRNNAEDNVWVEKLVDNPSIRDLYPTDATAFDYEGGLCDPLDDYDYVVITTEHGGLDGWDTTSEIPYNWESLLERHNNEGLSSTLVTIEQITACEDYHNEDPLFNDIQAHIREFCKDAYQDWGTSYVFVGGDDEWIKARRMKYEYESNAEADIYWSNLDKTFNADQDNYWGEEGDSGFDVYSELFIGRIPCDEPQDVSNWMTKSFYYADSLETEYLDNTAFYGGDTGWQCQGDDFMDYSAIMGTDYWLGPDPEVDGPFPDWAGFQFGFETWNEEHSDDKFEIDERWTAEPPNEGWQGGSSSSAKNGLRDAINNDHATIISGIAHANAYMSLDVYDSTWESSYTNTKPFFLHDFGCHCGDMSAADDGVLHSMLFHSDTELAFGVTYNTVYGWGNLYSTNSSSAFQAKAFWDYFLDFDNSGYPTNWELGKAHAWSKDIMAPTLDWDPQYGTWRSIIQACLLFADPAQKLKNPHPNLPPETPPSPEGPEVWAQFGEAEFSFMADDPEKNSVSFMLDWGDGTQSEWIGPFGSGQLGDATHIWSEIGVYEVKVKARDEHFGQSDWSNPTTIEIIENQGPNGPEITGPTSISPKRKTQFTFSADDPEGNELYFIISWGDGYMENLIGPYASGEEFTIGHSWKSEGEYTVACIAKDIYDIRSPQTSLKLSVKQPRAFNSLPLFRLFESLLSQFPILEKLLYN